MKSFAIYDTKTGEVLSLFSGSMKNLLDNVGEGEDYVEAPDGVVGMHVQDGALVPIVVSEEEREAEEVARSWDRLRHLRKAKLADSDWTQFPDSPANTEAWAEYRQKLRDLPSTVTDPRLVEWPEEPQ